MARPPSPRRALLGVVLAFALSGCGIFKVGPDYEEPVSAVPNDWFQAASEGFTGGNAQLVEWWEVLDDPLLTSLIERATVGNLDLQIAFTRIKQARAERGIATGQLFPDINADSTVERSRISEGVVQNVGRPQRRVDSFYGGGLNANYEIDLFGRVARNIESAEATVEASFENYRDVLVVLYGEVALEYIEVRTLQERIRAALENVETQRGALRLTRDRLDAQLAPELDVRQAELNLFTTSAVVPDLRRQLEQTVHRLSVLLGEEPSYLYAELVDPAPIPEPPSMVGVGMPSDILRRRPDVRQAEREIAAQNAQIGVAKADYFPRFSLVGAFAFETFTSQPFALPRRAFSFGPTMAWNIFDGGRVRNNVELQDAKTQELYVTYQNTVLQALQEVEDFMVGYFRERQRREELAKSVVAARESVRLVLELYTSGLTDFQNVLDSQRSLAIQEDDLAASEGLVVQNLAGLYRALGGGWEPDPPRLEEEIKEAEKGEPRF